MNLRQEPTAHKVSNLFLLKRWKSSCVLPEQNLGNNLALGTSFILVLICVCNKQAIQTRMYYRFGLGNRSFSTLLIFTTVSQSSVQILHVPLYYCRAATKISPPTVANQRQATLACRMWGDNLCVVVQRTVNKSSRSLTHEILRLSLDGLIVLPHFTV